MPPARNIVVGQIVEEAKLLRSRELRREMTQEESKLWEQVRGNHLGVRFRRQQIIDGFIADFYCHVAGLVVEIDGPIHEQQQEVDQQRDKVFAQRGLIVLRVTNDEVNNRFAQVLARIRQLCAARQVEQGG